MHTRYITLFVIIGLLTGCGQSRKEIVSQKLDEAIQLRDSGQYNLAKLKLDTIINNFNDLTEEAAFAIRMLDEIKLMEQQRNLQYLDSMIAVKEKELEPLLKNFIRSDEYGSQPILIHKRQRPENSYNRTFIRAHLDTKGEFYISSRYYGTSWIKHNQIKVYHAGESVTSEVVPQDGFNNRRFQDGDSKWEIVSYKDGADNGIINFIASNVDKPLKVQFIGEKYYYIVMEQFDKEAIRDGYETSFVLQELAGLREEKRQVKQQIEKLKKIAQSKEKSS
ncbi:hypothetical protein [Anaerophaga thermohalophila]|jgi:hypothetical protein|uniref:hypothetical protein n=1 Tax=Anaerophaga thermohalophila TaxID=177400 RepID=UPI0003177622|nr:hypothetical protein [Anaerophaga thermohalophila]